MSRDYLTIVSGLPRSGTSMMMQTLEAGGIPAMSDNIREADSDNPKGYYEFEPVKKTKEDPSWLEDADGKVVKMVYRLLYDLPGDRKYRVVFMRRDLDEVLASQKVMLDRLNKEAGAVGDEQMAAMFRKQLADFERWAGEQDHLSILEINYRDVVDEPMPQMERINEFLGGDLDLQAMAAVVTPSLYRQRK